MATDSHGSQRARDVSAVGVAAGQSEEAAHEVLVAEVRFAADRDVDLVREAVGHFVVTEWLYDGIARTASV